LFAAAAKKDPGFWTSSGAPSPTALSTEADSMTLGLTVFLVIAVLIASVGALWGRSRFELFTLSEHRKEPIDSVTCCPGR